ncbi:MAG: sugar phosphate isomerase/epimerase [Phycisphaerae bacterium]|nr:sugar phosphate isomerase/epimerase [Phycisphaerae bacterium]
MAKVADRQFEGISRRMFCRSAVMATAAFGVGRAFARAAKAGKRVRFYKNLAPGHIGVRANQRQALEYAVKYGFDSITPSAGEFANKSDEEIGAWLRTMKEKGIRYGAAGLPVQYRRDEEQFKKGLAGLGKQADLLKKLGVKRMATWLTPGHSELTYKQNFELHEKRLREVAEVLKDYDIRLGLEFVGPKTSRRRYRYEFIYKQSQIMELARAIGTGNVGVLMDSWHWYTSGGTVEELLQLSGKDIVHVHVNDAPAGIAVEQQIDNRRKLPATTGVIDLKGFINALVKIGYDGPVECEPFDQELRAMEDGAALQKTIDSLNRLWALIER